MMTYKQTQQYQTLNEKVKQAYVAFNNNTDKAKHDKLAQAWLKSIEKAEAYLEKHDK